MLGCLRALPGSGGPGVAVLDNAGMPPTKASKARRKGLGRRGIGSDDSPACNPESSRIVPVSKQVEHHEIPRRGRESTAEPRASVEAEGRKLDSRGLDKLGPAAERAKTSTLTGSFGGLPKFEHYLRTFK